MTYIEETRNVMSSLRRHIERIIKLELKDEKL